MAVKLTDALGHATELDSDQANQLVARWNPLDHAVQTTYDKVSRLAWIRDAEGNVTSFG